MNWLVAVLVLCFLSFSLASLPTKQNLRFKQVTGNHLGANSVDFEAMQDFAIATDAVQNHAITNSKLAPITITADEISPGSVTANGLAVDLVRLIIRDGTVHAASQDPTVTLPNDVTSIKPFEFTNTIVGSTVNADYPNPALSYRVEGKAKGPGIILGWYPNSNGHLLRYQSSRALRGLVCADIGLAPETIAVGDAEDSDFNEFADFFSVTFSLEDNWVSDLPINTALPVGPCTAFCSSLDTSLCSQANYLGDPFCNNYRPIVNPDDVSQNSPDRCGRYTNAEDVLNPQEGTPVYSPAVERITIDDTGLVEMRFFGRGSSLAGVNINIDVTVVVLLFDQYGASSQF